MARIRPASAYRDQRQQPWSRFSKSKPRKSYVRAKPYTKLLVFNMGKDSSAYDLVATLNAVDYIQLRSNAIESARLEANRYLASKIPENFYLKVLTYPHNVLREHKMGTTAGADRLSRGMVHAYGKAVGVAARLNDGQALFMVKTKKGNEAVVRDAFVRASRKLSGSYKVRFS
jgi:Ribosomal protein L16/L10E